MKQYNCGINPESNVYLVYRGGCEKSLALEDAYRCTGCNQRFHKDCILKHFEQEKEHDWGRQQERELIKKIFNPINKEDLLPIGEAISKWIRLHEELGGEIVWQKMGDDFIPHNERPIKVIYYSPLRIFHGMMGITEGAK